MHSHCMLLQGLPAVLRLPAALGLLVRSVHPSSHGQPCPRCHMSPLSHRLLVTRNTLPGAGQAPGEQLGVPAQDPRLPPHFLHRTGWVQLWPCGGPFIHSRWLCGLLCSSPTTPSLSLLFSPIMENSRWEAEVRGQWCGPSHGEGGFRHKVGCPGCLPRKGSCHGSSF